MNNANDTQTVQSFDFHRSKYPQFTAICAYIDAQRVVPASIFEKLSCLYGTAAKEMGEGIKWIKIAKKGGDTAKTSGHVSNDMMRELFPWYDKLFELAVLSYGSSSVKLPEIWREALTVPLPPKMEAWLAEELDKVKED